MSREAAVERLYQAARETARRAGCAAQVAVACPGEPLAFRSFGSAPFQGERREAAPESLFAVFSVTKAFTSSAAWILLQEGKLRLADRVVDFLPEFAAGGKHVVTVEQLLTHTAGFPAAQLEANEWADEGRRRARFASWTLEWEPGTRFVYHGSSSMWILAELITQISGSDYRDFIRSRIFEPLALSSDLFLGLPEAEQARVADVVTVGEAMSDEERAVSPVDAPTLSNEVLIHFNRPEVRAVGSPGGGAFGTAAAVAQFYQGVLGDLAGDGPGIWDREVLEDAVTPRFLDLIDPMTGKPACRGLGFVVAGESERIWRGFAEECSARSIGHMGAGGQVAWADPESGISFAFCTNGAQQNAARQGANGLRLSILAAGCR